MFTKEKILEVLRQIDKDKYGIKKIGIFGSYAKEEANEKSDIDVIVDLVEEKDDYSNVMRIKYELEEIFNCDIDVVVEEDLKQKPDCVNPRVQKYKERIQGEILSSVLYA